MQTKIIKPAIVTILTLVFSTTYFAETTIHKNEQTGLLTWSAEQDGFKIELIQLIPDFVSAVYSKHKFPQKELDRINTYCLFGTIVESKSDKNLYYQVSDWHYTDMKGVSLPVKNKKQWITEWRAQGIKFNWTLLPATSEFAPGDWQQGFTTIKISRDKIFDFTYSWSIEGKTYTNTIKDMSCAPETLELDGKK